MSEHDLDRPLSDDPADTEQDLTAAEQRRDFLRRAGLMTGAAVVGGALGQGALAQPVLRAAPVLLDKAAVQTRLNGLGSIQAQSQRLAESAMLLRGLEIVRTFNPDAAASFDLSFGLRW
ncbi:twin-arginine translocation signal domain-containing protein [Deinococcus aquaedulcis]|uniref:twin-arginine translocation signal domain-containing protein n=1 Tax=Deinococcus aquaedulcis TaxID=2840455 RepID=UPI001C82C2EA|nr:twin-arginine translocation signal domain-containing protein [Deinococcus aquaedulcis]